jgi:hypothetical protein
MKSKVEIYALSVCFASVVCLVISSGIASYSVVEVVAPQLTMSAYAHNKFQTNESYLKSKRSCEKDKDNEVAQSDAELTKEREIAFSVALVEESRKGMQSLIKTFMFILVSSVALLMHWKLANAARGE